MIRGGCKATIAANYEGERLVDGSNPGMAHTGESHGVAPAPNGWVFYIGRADCRTNEQRGQMIGVASSPRILDFANRNVGIGCGNVHIWDPETANGTVNSGVTLAGILPVYGDRGGGSEINGKIEAGLLGITVAPDFAETGHIYLQYFPTFNPDNPVHPGLADGDQRRITKMSKGRVCALHGRPRDQAARARLRGRDLRVRVPDLQLLPPRRRHGLRLRGQPLRHHRRLELVAEHERLLGQLPARALPDRRPGGGLQRALRQQQHLLQRRAPHRRQHQRLQRQDAAVQPRRHDPRRVAADDRRQQHVHAAERGPRRTARTSSTAPRATAARPSPRSTRWACATRRACSSTPRPTSRTRRGSAPTPARRRRPRAPRRTRAPRSSRRPATTAGPTAWATSRPTATASPTARCAPPTRPASSPAARPAAPTQGWYDCNNIVNDSTNNTGLTVLPHTTGTGMDAGRARPLNLWYSRGNPGGTNGCPDFPRENGANGAPNYGATPTQLCPYLTASGATVFNGPVYRYDDDAEDNSVALARVLGRALVPAGLRQQRAPSTACCSTPPPTRTAASRSTRTASAGS